VPITGFRPLLQSLDLRGVVVTADALHAQRYHARFLVEDKGAHYVLGLKGNQPTLAEAAHRLFGDAAVVHETHDKGHGRTEHRYFRVVTVRRSSLPSSASRRPDSSSRSSGSAPTSPIA